MMTDAVTKLAEQIGLKPGMRCWFHNMPEALRAAIAPDAVAVEEQPTASDGMQCAHLYVTTRERLERELRALSPLMATKGFIWIAWPASGGEATDLDDTAVRAVAAAHGLAACSHYSVDDRWVALKLAKSPQG